MADAILTDNDRKAELSFAYLAALAAYAGFTCQTGPAARCGERRCHHPLR